MIRVLLYLLVLAALAYGGMLLVENPGHITLHWFGEVVDAPAALLIVAIAVAAVILWSVARFVLGLPSFVRFASRQRRREKGYAALSRGLVAVNAGDARTATRAAQQAEKHLKNDPLAMMLRAQSAHLNGDEHESQAAFAALAQREETRILGLRGLYADAKRRGDEEAARQFATAAYGAKPLAWSAQAVLEEQAAGSRWEQALRTVEQAIAANHLERETGERQRAVLETAIAQEKAMTAPDEALALVRQAIRRAPDLAPAATLAAQLLSRRGDIRKASRLIEKAWPRCRHPDLAQAYLDVRPGDSTTDRLSRAKTLMGIASYDPISRMTVARAALANKDFDTARGAMAPLIAEGKQPSVRMCLLMAELEEAEHGDLGQWREWLARASRAPLDPAWVADGVVYDQWAPASPTTGRLDAFQWQVPAERLGPAIDSLPIPPRRQAALSDAPSEALLPHDKGEADVKPTPGTAPALPPSSEAAAEILPPASANSGTTVVPSVASHGELPDIDPEVPLDESEREAISVARS